jgi:hypothetical protein
MKLKTFTMRTKQDWFFGHYQQNCSWLREKSEQGENIQKDLQCYRVEMEKPLVIGKAAKQRCFKSLNINNLPVIWRNTEKIEQRLNMFNAEMKKENRNAIHILDNATCHQKVTLSKVKIAWFRANATSAIQPRDTFYPQWH